MNLIHLWSEMAELLLHPQTDKKLASALQHHTHALLLIAPHGAGKGSVLHKLTADILGVTPEKLENEGRYLRIEPDGKSVTIDQVRSLQHFLTLKTTGTAQIRRVITIEQADTMTRDAQNALLKTLEEPPADTMIILSAAQAEDILPTIHSRAQTITLTPPTKQQVVAYFTEQGATIEHVERLYDISGGHMGLLSSLIAEDTENSLIQAIEAAKQLLRKSTFERLALVDALSKQKDETVVLLTALKRMCRAALEQAAHKDERSATTKAWHSRLQAVLAAEEALGRNANLKLLLTDLFLAL